MESNKKQIRAEQAMRHDYVIRTALDEDVEINSYPYLERVYDAQGNLISDKTYNDEGEIQEFFAYAYDDAGRRIETKSFYDEDEVIETTTYHYGDSRHPQLALKKYADTSEEKIIFEYDSEGRLIKKMVINDENEVEEQESWRFEGEHEVWYEKEEWGDAVFTEEQTYDAEGRLIGIKLQEGDFYSTTIHRIQYNEQGERYLIEKFDDEGEKIGVIRMDSYDNGRPTEVTETGPSGIRRVLYNYDRFGNPVLQQEFDGDDIMVSEIIRTYDEDGLILSTDVTNDRKGVGMNQHYRIEYTYEYF